MLLHQGDFLYTFQSASFSDVKHLTTLYTLFEPIESWIGGIRMVALVGGRSRVKGAVEEVYDGRY